MRQAMEKLIIASQLTANDLQLCSDEQDGRFGKTLDFILDAICEANKAIAADDKERNRIHFDRVDNDINGNPRYVVHFLQCRPDESYTYANTVRLMNKIGGRKYHNKSYGGGIVFQSYNTDELENLINELKRSK